MTNPTRVLLLNINNAVTREEIKMVDRIVGEAYFAGLNLQYGSHFIAESHGKLAASWLVPEDKILDVIDVMKTKAAPTGYKTVLMMSLTGKTETSEAHYN